MEDQNQADAVEPEAKRSYEAPAIQESGSFETLVLSCALGPYDDSCAPTADAS